MAAPARPRTIAEGRVVAGRGIEATATRDRNLVWAFLERDRLFAGYALCALEERAFERARWGIATRDGEPVALAMEQGGPAPQPVFLVGEPEAAGFLLRGVIRPWSAYISAPPELLPVPPRLQGTAHRGVVQRSQGPLVVAG